MIIYIKNNKYTIYYNYNLIFIYFQTWRTDIFISFRFHNYLI